MKKLLLIIIIAVTGTILLPSTLIVSSVDTIIPEALAETDEEKEKRLLDEIKKNDETIKKNNESLAEVEKDPSKTIPGQESRLRTDNKILEGKNEELRKEATPIRVKRVEEEYKQLIESSKIYATNIQQEIDRCGTPCANKKILDKRKLANIAYTEYLTKEAEVAKCKAKLPPCDEKELKPLQDAAKIPLKKVKDLISKINALEREREQKRGFEVSRIFSVDESELGEGETRVKGVIDVANTIATWLLTLVSSLAVTTLIIGGFLMIISGGDESRLETGKTIFTYSLIGIVVTLSAFGIISFIQSIFYQ